MSSIDLTIVVETYRTFYTIDIMSQWFVDCRWKWWYVRMCVDENKVKYVEICLCMVFVQLLILVIFTLPRYWISLELSAHQVFLSSTLWLVWVKELPPVFSITAGGVSLQNLDNKPVLGHALCIPTCL